MARLGFCYKPVRNYTLFSKDIHIPVGRDSVVGIAIPYRLDGRRIECKYHTSLPQLSRRNVGPLNFKRRIKSHLPFAGIIRSSPYSPRLQDKG